MIVHYPELFTLRTVGAFTGFDLIFFPIAFCYLAITVFLICMDLERFVKEERQLVIAQKVQDSKDKHLVRELFRGLFSGGKR